MNLRESMLVGVVAFGLLVTALSSPAWAQENTTAPWFTAVPTILLRTPDPGKLADFYIALGMTVDRVNSRGSVVIYHENGGGSLEIVRMHEGTQPGPPKDSRTQQGVVAIFQTTDLLEVVRRAREANSPLVEKSTLSPGGSPIYYIADWENNVFGYTQARNSSSIRANPQS